MKFEKFLLDDYMQTPQGKKVYSFFADLKHIYFHDRKKLYNFVDSMLDISCAEESYSPDGVNLDEREFEKKETICSIEEFITVMLLHLHANSSDTISQFSITTFLQSRNTFGP